MTGEMEDSADNPFARSELNGRQAFIRQFVLLKYVVKFYSILVQRKNHVNLTKILQSGIFVAWTTDFLFICVYNNISF